RAPRRDHRSARRRRRIAGGQRCRRERGAPRPGGAAAVASRAPATADRARQDRGPAGARDRAPDRHVGVGGQGRRASRPEDTGREDPERAMKTDDLVTMLATGAPPVERPAVSRRFALALGWGALGASL